MTVRDTVPQSRPDHTRSITGDQGNVFKQDVDRMVTRSDVTGEVAEHRFDNFDIGTNGDSIAIEPDTLAGSTTVMIALQSEDNLEFDITFDVVKEDGTTLFNLQPPRFQSVTEVWGMFPVLHPNLRVNVNDFVHSHNEIAGGISFRTGDSDAMVDYGTPNIETGQATANVMDGVIPIAGSSVPVPRGTQVAVKALSTNTDPVFVGDIDTVGTSTGMELPPDQGVNLSPFDVEEIGMIVQTDGDGVSWIVEVA